MDRPFRMSPIRHACRAWFAWCALLAAPFLTAMAPAAELVLWQAGDGLHMRPPYIAANRALIESRPFDGMAIDTATSWVLMSGLERSEAAMRSDFAPITSNPFQVFKANYALIYVIRPVANATYNEQTNRVEGTPADFHDDAIWQQLATRFATYARVCRDIGLRGVFFDNESYTRSIWRFPQDVSHPYNASTGKGYTLAQYQAKAYQRGRQLMLAMQAEWPDIRLFFAHGINEAVPSDPYYWIEYQTMGAFCAGVVSARGAQARVFDGGEEHYQLRTQPQFDASYQRRKYEVADGRASFIPAALRPTWPDLVSVGFMTYNLQFPANAGRAMTPAVMRQITKMALRTSEGVVIHYAEGWGEGFDWLVPTGQVRDGMSGVPADYIAAVREGRAAAAVQTPPPPTPPTWSNGDIGNVAAAGSASWTGGTCTVRGSGADIWGSRDEFHFVRQALTGDGEIIARVASQTATNGWAKAGVMIRESLADHARFALLATTPGNGLAFQRRLTTGGACAHTSGPRVPAPRWLKLTRVGQVVSAHESADGATWRQVGSATIAMGSNAFIGLAVTSHRDGTVSTAVFDHVSVVSGVASAAN